MPDDRIKRPAYQWNVLDARSDEVFMLMSFEQRGVYRELLDQQWIEGSLPSQPKHLAGLLKMSAAKFSKLWPLISSKFRSRDDGRLVNDRLESYRAEVDAYCAIQAENGKKGGRPRNPSLTQRLSELKAKKTTTSLTTTTTPVSKEQKQDSPVVLTFPVIGMDGHEWGLTEAQVTEWGEAYPGLDVKAEARKALAWIKAKTGRKKTARGMAVFLVGWLNRAVEYGRSGQIPAVRPQATASQIGRRSIVPPHEPL